MSSSSESLCRSCFFVRAVRGRRGQRYLLCRNDAIPAKYPRQPVLTCPGYRELPQPDGSSSRR